MACPKFDLVYNNAEDSFFWTRYELKQSFRQFMEEEWEEGGSGSRYGTKTYWQIP